MLRRYRCGLGNGLGPFGISPKQLIRKTPRRPHAPATPKLRGWDCSMGTPEPELSAPQCLPGHWCSHTQARFLRLAWAAGGAARSLRIAYKRPSPRRGVYNTMSNGTVLT